jgi:hypothetical protein
MMCDSLQEGSLHQKAITEDRFFFFVQRLLVVLHHLQVQQLALVIPFIQGMRGVKAFVALQPDQVRFQRSCHYFGDLRFAHAGRSFDEEGFIQLQGKKHRHGDCFSGDIALLCQQRADVGKL